MTSLIGSLLLSAPAVAAEADLSQLLIRARVVAMEPEVPVRIHWRYGGEGQGGGVIGGEFTRLKRSAPAAPKELPGLKAEKKKDLLGEDDPLADLLGGEEKDQGQIEIEGQGFNFVYVKLDTWSPAMPVTNFGRGSHITVTLQPYSKGEESPLAAQSMRNVKMEFELLLGDKVLKRFSEAGPDGPTVGISVPTRMLAGGMKPDDKQFLDAVCGLARYAERRAEFLESLPWANRPLPRKYAIVTDCGGYKHGAGYGVRTTNLDVIANEFRALRQLGVNGLRGAPAEAVQLAAKNEGFAKGFNHALLTHGMGYPTPSADRDEETGQLLSVPEGAGCPYHPDMLTNARPKIEETVREMTARTGFKEIWALTQDEIGCVFDKAGEGKNHRYVCPHCIRGYRQMLQAEGRTPADFGKQSWEEVDPWTGSAPRPDTWQVAMRKVKDAAYQKALGFKVKVPGEDDDDGAGLDVLEDLAQGDKAELAEDLDTEKVSTKKATAGENLLNYYNARFLNYASARAFTPLKDAFAAANAQKQAALESGQTNSAAAQQPFVYSYALRGQTFIRTHSLDFFEFYRHADNGFVYETSHTDRFTHIFDSYICDVGRVVSQRMDKRFGIYVKPHRGSGVQRAMSFASRGGTMLYWYTYGPEYSKGDSFASKPWLLEEMSRCARLLGAAEDVLYGAQFAQAAEVAVVKPRTTTLLGGNYSNALWTYVALTHDHVPVDPLDETMLETADLSQYKVIYVSGKYLRRAAAARLADWVKQGGTLYTSGGGMMYDEAQQPLEILWPVFGLKTRTAFEQPPQGEALPAGWKLAASKTFSGDFHPRGREKLSIMDDTVALESFADGSPAMIRHKFGQGQAVLVAFAAGDEYGAKLRSHSAEDPADMEAHADPALRSFVTQAVLPFTKRNRPVDVDKSNIEAILLQNPQNKRRAVTLINWAYARDEAGTLRHKRFENVEITIAPGQEIKQVRSAWLDKELPFQRDGEQVTLTLPEIWEADVLLLE